MRRRALIFALLACSAMLPCSLLKAEPAKADPLIMVVMDPLAKPLSCPCVAGYAQRDYDKLGAALKAALGRDVKVLYNDSLIAAVRKQEDLKPDLVIGKCSVVLHDAKTGGWALEKVAMLTGKDGLTTQRGLVVVAAGDPAKSLSN